MRIMKNKIQGLTLVLLTLLTLSAGREVCATLLDLGTLGGTTSNAWAVKSDGAVVVGSSLNATAQTQAFLWTANSTFTSGTMNALNFLAGGTAAEARAINTVGLVAGYSRDGSAVEQAVTWSGVTPTAISNTLGGSGARAFGVSTSGDVVGWARNGSGVQVAFVAVGGVMTALDLTVLGTLHDPVGFSHNARALAISPDGRYVVGEYDVDNGFGTPEVHAFVYDRTVPANSYEFSSGGVGSARATNGTSVVGTITNPPDALAAFGGVGGGTGFLPQLAGATGVASAINLTGVVGGTQFVTGLGQRAVFWDSPSLGANVTDLNDLHSTGNILTDTTAIANVLNVYAGNGTFGGQTHGFLLVVPEPGTLALLLVGGMGIVAKRRTK
jgi:probable HAF family extracellular repeat protein